MYDLWVVYTNLNGRFYIFKSLYKFKDQLLWIRLLERNDDYDEYLFITSKELIVLRFRMNYNSLYINTEIVSFTKLHMGGGVGIKYTTTSEYSCMYISAFLNKYESKKSLHENHVMIFRIYRIPIFWHGIGKKLAKPNNEPYAIKYNENSVNTLVKLGNEMLTFNYNSINYSILSHNKYVYDKIRDVKKNKIGDFNDRTLWILYRIKGLYDLY